MKQNYEQVTESELHQFVDGELGEARARQLGALIAENADLTRKIESYREINRRLGKVLGTAPNEPVPSRFTIALASRATPGWMRAAAAAALLAVGGLVGYSLHGPPGASAFVRPVAVEAAFAHAVFVPEIRHPVEVGASEQEHLNAWLSKRLQRPIAAPDLRQDGYMLIGGRLLPDAHRPAAQFMFENANGNRLTLYIRHALARRDSAFGFAEQEGLGIVYWIDDGLAYAVTGQADKVALTAAAELVYREINP